LSQVEKVCHNIRKQNCVQYAGPLAGHKRGVYTINGSQVLVTKSPVFIEPADIPTPNWDGVYEMFVDPEHRLDQRPQFWAWLKCAIATVRRGKFRPGQALVLVGPRNCGKSLLQDMITSLLGGRMGKPYRYMSGGTDFNAELFESEFLSIDDEQNSYRMDDRADFASKIKEFCVSSKHSCHGKNRQAITLEPVWRLSLCVNDEEEHLRVLPPLADGVKDKLHILKVRLVKFPMPTTTDDEWNVFGEALKAELPGVAYKMDRWEIPASMRVTDVASRYGFDTFQHPEVVRVLSEMNPESVLLEYIRAEIVQGGCISEPLPNGWRRMSSIEVESYLCTRYPTVRNLLRGGKLGNHLAKLAKRLPDKIKHTHLAHGYFWDVSPEL
jgi:hypothetical protein